MAIAATQAGINTMVANTPTQGGCGFGCHEFDPAADNLGNAGNPGGEDNYALARNLGVTLRIDNLPYGRTATDDDCAIHRGVQSRQIPHGNLQFRRRRHDAGDAHLEISRRRQPKPTIW